MKIRDLMGRDAVQFIVCSNDQSALSDILNSEYNCVAAPGHELVDMYCLTKCSYVVGPPSTFSLWASFYGNVPLYSMKKPDVDFTLNDFQTINYF